MKSGLKLNTEAYLGLGANLGTPKETFHQALRMISGFANVMSVSRLYRSKPFGYAEQPPFFNAAARVSTNLSALELLDYLQSVERGLGKKVVRENGPRIIDLDLLLYGNLEMKSRKLVLPHPGILLRDFVLLPLIDLNPELRHPQWSQKTLKSALDGLQERFVGESPDDWDFCG